jgi:curli biogenesis system outer membrane secretion channel CsgG
MKYIKNIFQQIVVVIIVLFSINSVHSQVFRVAILDFQNISGITKYDGLGKAMSSMLISDIESNVSPKTLQLVERSQIQKILNEQNFQESGRVNKSTAVQAGKIDYKFGYDDYFNECENYKKDNRIARSKKK